MASSEQTSAPDSGDVELLARPSANDFGRWSPAMWNAPHNFIPTTFSSSIRWVERSRGAVLRWDRLRANSLSVLGA